MNQTVACACVLLLFGLQEPQIFLPQSATKLQLSFPQDLSMEILK